MEKIKGYLMFAGVITIILNFFLLGHGWYQDRQARLWVDSITGQYIDGTLERGKMLIHWDATHAPPSCPVTIHGVFANNGYSVSDFGVDLSTADHHAVHLAKNGKTSPEPIGDTAYNFITERPGEWHYKLDFTFHCSAIGKTQWLFWLNLDNTYTATPVVIDVGEGDDNS